MKMKTLQRIGMLSVIALCSAMPLFASGAGEQGGDGTGAAQSVQLKWYLPSGALSSVTPDGLDAVVEAMNAITLPRINATINPQLVSIGDYVTRMQTIDAAGGDYDLCFTSNWFSPFAGNVSKGAYAPLDSLLTEHAPDLMDVTPAYAWESLKVGGSVYAMPNQQNWRMSEGFYLRRDMAEKYGFVPEEVNTWESIEALFGAMRDGEPDDFYPAYVDQNYHWPYYLGTFGFEEVTGRNIPGAYYLDGSEGYTIVNQFATPEFREHADMMRRWNENGYIRSDSATYSLGSDNITNDQRAGRIGTAQLGFVAPHVAAMAESSWDNQYEAIPVLTIGGYAINSVIQSSLTAVSVNSDNKERAVEYFNLIIADPELYNTLLWGVEGVNFERVNDTQITLNPNTGYGTGRGQVVPDFMCGRQFSGWVLAGRQADIWDQVQNWSSQATPSDILGFVFDPEPVKTEIANCSAVVSEELRMLDAGSVEDVDAALDRFLSNLETAGSDRIIAEAQRQLDAWVETKR